MKIFLTIILIFRLFVATCQECNVKSKTDEYTKIHEVTYSDKFGTFAGYVISKIDTQIRIHFYMCSVDPIIVNETDLFYMKFIDDSVFSFPISYAEPSYTTGGIYCMTIGILLNQKSIAILTNSKLYGFKCFKEFKAKKNDAEKLIKGLKCVISTP